MLKSWIKRVIGSPSKEYDVFVDELATSSIRGWVRNKNNDDPLVIDIDVQGQCRLESVFADRHRPDVAKATNTHGSFGFNAEFNRPLPAGKHAIRIYDAKKRHSAIWEAVISVGSIEESHQLGSDGGTESLAHSLISHLVRKIRPGASDYRIIEKAFDRHFYCKKYLEGTSQKAIDPIRHYLEQGCALGYNPTAWFSSLDYLESNPDVLEAGVNPFVHYMTDGYKERRRPQAASRGISYLEDPWADQDGFIVLSKCTLLDGWFSIEGYAVNPEFPGLPVRVDLSLSDGPRKTVLASIARQPVQARLAEKVADHSFFRCKFPVPASLNDLILRVGIHGRAKVDAIALLPVEGEFTAAEPLEYPAPQEGWKVVGSVERVDARIITGWAMYESSQNTPLTLVLSLDGKPISTTNCHQYREDIRATYGGDGYAGFTFELPPEIGFRGSDPILDISPAIGDNHIQGCRTPALVPSGLLVPAGTNFAPTAHELHAQPGRGSRSVSIIVLNRNGADLLKDLFDSAHQVEDPERIEWIIVDHASDDHSHDVAQACISRGQTIRFIRRDGNFSFSNSNNYGARLASHDALVFANNDLIFRNAFTGQIIDVLSDPAIGALGTILYDYLPAGSGIGGDIVQHTGVYISDRIASNWIRPYEARPIDTGFVSRQSISEVPVATGAFLAMRKDDFQAVGGFDEDYIYGLEDVDLCLKVRSRLNKKIVCLNDLDIVHHRGYSRNKETDVAVRHRNNNDYLNRRWAHTLRRDIRSDAIARPGFWTGRLPVVAFIVADAGDNTVAGEYYTALELGRELQKEFSCHLQFIKKEDWYDLSGVDVLVTMVNPFDITRARNINPFLVTINWTRQWFDRWAENETIYAYDHVLASSGLASVYLAGMTGLAVETLPIATNYEQFQSGEAQDRFRSDYCFTGNYVGTKREIMYQLKPELIQATGAVYGSGWEGLAFDGILRGPVAYSDVPHLYASTKIVIDDANIATKEWGSCNSRIFDAIAADCLIVTNGPEGVRELFGDLVPTFDSADSLAEIIDYWASHEDERRARVEQLQAIVRGEHCYMHRARKLVSLLKGGKYRPRVAIKCGAKWKEKEHWGDYHFAQALAKELRRQGFIVRVDCREQWDIGLSAADDVVLCLRGILPYSPKPHQANIMWVISHPDDITTAEVDRYDHVYVASEFHCEHLKAVAQVGVETLLQCTDTDRFKPRYVDDSQRGRSNPIFVGNSRGVFRQCVRWSVELEKDIDIYGGGWDQFVKDHRLKAKVLPNVSLPAYYESARAVLCDHWDDMKSFGYLSNRAFDVLACGSWLVVDDVRGIDGVLPGGYTVYRNREELGGLLDMSEHGTSEEKRRLAKWVRENHGFSHRAEVIAGRIRSLLDIPDATQRQAHDARKTSAQT
jgi:GT2 family glycosyltransferase